MKRAKGTTREMIKAEWDAIAPLRHEQITSGIDVSYVHVLVPELFNLLEDCDLRCVLDMGCGSGVLTAELAAKAEHVVGVDISQSSVAIAAQACSALPNVEILEAAVEELPLGGYHKSFTTVVANMTLTACPGLETAVAAIASCLVEGGRLAATIAHPNFWPRYWGYESLDWFDYSQELEIVAPFRISKQKTDFLTTHFHRPLSMYSTALRDARIVLDYLGEPMPDRAAALLYHRPWPYPRFLSLRGIRQS